MNEYWTISELKYIDLSESYVLDVTTHPALVEFRMEYFLLPEHAEYLTPGPDEYFHPRKGWLRFQQVSELEWKQQGAPPARDASGSYDYGNIDSLLWSGSEYRLEGSWGQMRILAKRLEVSLDGS